MHNDNNHEGFYLSKFLDNWITWFAFSFYECSSWFLVQSMCLLIHTVSWRT